MTLPVPIRRCAWNTRLVTRRLIEDHPDLYLGIQKWRHRKTGYRDRFVDKDTDIVIEGYPRSANSFAAQAFRRSQTKEVRLSHHTHSYAQIIVATQLGIPTVTLIRHPDECIISLKALNLQAYEDPRMDEIIGMRGYIVNYIRFYERVLPCLSQCVLAKFEDVVADFGAVIARVNAKFGTEFDLYDDTEEVRSEIFKVGGFHLSPSDEREAIKQRVQDQYFDPSNAELVKRARAIYEEVIQSTSQAIQS